MYYAHAYALPRRQHREPTPGYALYATRKNRIFAMRELIEFAFCLAYSLVCEQFQLHCYDLQHVGFYTNYG